MDAIHPCACGPALSTLPVAAGELPGPPLLPVAPALPFSALTVPSLPDGPVVALPILAAANGFVFPELPLLGAAFPLPASMVAMLPLGPRVELNRFAATNPPLAPDFPPCNRVLAAAVTPFFPPTWATVCPCADLIRTDPCRVPEGEFCPLRK